jgi:anti-sigma factor RsiW
MSDPSRLNEEEHEELVAFLDGELTEDDAHKVEAKLNTDATVRAEAEALRQTWDLLDYLPKPEPSPDFTNRTMERIGPVRKTQTMARRGILRKVLLGVGWAAAVVIAVGLGYAGMAHLLTKREPSDADLVRELRLIENKRMYELAEDMKFLSALDDPELFGDEPADQERSRP